VVFRKKKKTGPLPRKRVEGSPLSKWGKDPKLRAKVLCTKDGKSRRALHPRKGSSSEGEARGVPGERHQKRTAV